VTSEDFRQGDAAARRELYNLLRKTRDLGLAARMAVVLSWLGGNIDEIHGLATGKENDVHRETR
jgi:hypothetical protein